MYFPAQAAQGISKLVCYFGAGDPDAIVRQGARGSRRAQHRDFSAARRNHRQGCDRREALEWLCERMGVRPNQVVAIGDRPNDVPMLLWVGRGVAMGNVHATVLETVSERTNTQEEDGFARLIETMLSVSSPSPLMSS
jgi:3-deoxy-D-manno-octulosonate 8-phosphate phosphatase KdsC-like HAD superfamily phosphatase